MNNLQSYSIDDLTRWEQEIRFADIITVHGNSPYSFRAVTVSQPEFIEFHVPRRFTEIMAGCLHGQPLVKYSTNYAEAAASWSPSTSPARRISTVIGLEIQYRGALQQLDNEQLKAHLLDTQRAQAKRIGDSDILTDLDQDYFMENLLQIAGFRLVKSDAACTVNSLTLRYRSAKDRLATADRLDEFAQKDTRFGVAARLLRQDVARVT